MTLSLLYRSLTGYNRFALWLLGRTGAGKSFLARLTQSFFGDFLGQEDRVTNWSSTANYIQRQGYYFRDAVYLVDDFKPGLVQPKEVTRIVQAYADNTGRGRLQRDARSNKTRPIRGMLLCTGEDLPENNASTIARTVVLRMPHAVKDLQLGHECLRAASSFPAVTADLIASIARDNWRGEFAELVGQYQAEFYQDIRGRDNDSRIAGNFAMLAAGFEVFAGYMSDVWADAIADFVAELRKVRDAMVVEAREQTASQVFLRQLGALIDAGRCTLLADGQSRLEARGTIVGHRLKNGHLGIIMPKAIRVVEEALKVSGHTLGCTQRGLLNLLEQDGVLVSRSTQARDGSSKLPRMAVLRAQALLGETADQLSDRIDDELMEEKREQQAQRMQLTGGLRFVSRVSRVKTS